MQLDFFSRQLAVAADLNRPASVHCVNAMGALITAIKATAAGRGLPPAVAIHSFSGTALQVREILRLEGTSPPPENKRMRKARKMADEKATAAAEAAAAEAAGAKSSTRGPSGEETAVFVPSPPPRGGGCKGGEACDSAATGSQGAGANCTLFFGFSHTVNVAMGCGDSAPKLAKLREAIRAVPDDRLVIESDEVGGASGLGRIAAAMGLAVELVAKAKGWDEAHAARVTSANGLRFLRAGRCA